MEAATRDLEQETSLNPAAAAARDPAAAGVQDRRAVVAMDLAAMAQEQETELDLTVMVTVSNWVTLVLADRASALRSSWLALVRR